MLARATLGPYLDGKVLYWRRTSLFDFAFDANDFFDLNLYSVRLLHTFVILDAVIKEDARLPDFLSYSVRAYRTS